MAIAAESHLGTILLAAAAEEYWEPHLVARLVHRLIHN